MKPARSFASDNNAGVHPEVLQAIAKANQGHAFGYGSHPYTESVGPQFKTTLWAGYNRFLLFVSLYSF